MTNGTPPPSNGHTDHRRARIVVLSPHDAADHEVLLEAIERAAGNETVVELETPERLVSMLRRGIRVRAVLVDAGSQRDVTAWLSGVRLEFPDVPVVALSDRPSDRVAGADETVAKDFRGGPGGLAPKLRVGMALAAANAGHDHIRALLSEAVRVMG